MNDGLEYHRLPCPHCHVKLRCHPDLPYRKSLFSRLWRLLHHKLTLVLDRKKKRGNLLYKRDEDADSLKFLDKGNFKSRHTPSRCYIVIPFAEGSRVEISHSGMNNTFSKVLIGVDMHTVLISPLEEKKAISIHVIVREGRRPHYLMNE
uniref:Uncharacterized protein n=1 Tax=Solanum lycopersicum TaxID=4081 RepID=A0A3Q7HT98_SOLLC